MPHPRLTFGCELDLARLTALFSDTTVLADLQALGAHVAPMLSDLSAERAAAVRRLNTAGIPVVAIPLVPVADGYYFTVDNAPQAAKRYDEWKAWTARHGLVWEGVGLCYFNASKRFTSHSTARSSRAATTSTRTAASLGATSTSPAGASLAAASRRRPADAKAAATS